MESHVVLDFQLSASSSKYSLSAADKGRLNLNYTFNTTTSEIETYGGWIAADDDNVPWLQVDFITNVTISGIATQGEDEGEAWVTSYEISYGYSKNSLQDYQVDGQVKTFLGPKNVMGICN
ncbi:Hypothetical predicted protein [Paramuricea clavata]|uniref:Uncharacterized protein n=1 Tax=Paramuricea clavata TaxID=317549 RepID=A0A7D9DK43_PARCT|nr:Hypothetical predicted protein [Paramuricea clavata]